MISVEYVKTEEELRKVLRLCYRLLAPELMETLPGERDDGAYAVGLPDGEGQESGAHAGELPDGEGQEEASTSASEASGDIYAYAAWKERMGKYSSLLLYALSDGELAAAVLGRPESEESLVCGMVACDEKFRRRGITKCLMERFAENARGMGFRYITLGADADAEGFYEKCGYHVIFEIHGQKIYQQMLG